MVDVFFTILPIFYLLLYIVIFLLGLWAYKETQNQSPLFIAIAFAIFTLIFLLNQLSFSSVIMGITILMRIIAYLMILYAVYNIGISYAKKKNSNTKDIEEK